MKKRQAAAIKKTILCVIAGLAAVQFAREFPAIVRYYKMNRL
jgi:hypothetical protein